ncbi:hypothetical protein MKS88_001803 [Plasmodium brasilianum]|nr:hypothetical protein MKS88_001803 [Plasmodium brasilianum]
MGQNRNLMFFIRINVFIVLTWIYHIDDKMVTINKNFYRKNDIYRILCKKTWGFLGKRTEGDDSNIVSVKNDIPIIVE